MSAGSGTGRSRTRRVGSGRGRSGGRWPESTPGERGEGRVVRGASTCGSRVLWPSEDLVGGADEGRGVLSCRVLFTAVGGRTWV